VLQDGNSVLVQQLVQISALSRRPGVTKRLHTTSPQRCRVVDHLTNHHAAPLGVARQLALHHRDRAVGGHHTHVDEPRHRRQLPHRDSVIGNTRDTTRVTCQQRLQMRLVVIGRRLRGAPLVGSATTHQNRRSQIGHRHILHQTDATVPLAGHNAGHNSSRHSCAQAVRHNITRTWAARNTREIACDPSNQYLPALFVGAVDQVDLHDITPVQRRFSVLLLRLRHNALT
jgi:hypothetical protein